MRCSSRETATPRPASTIRPSNSTTRAIKAKPDHANALNNRGNALQAKGSYDMAIADFDKAIQIKPDFAAAYCNRGNAYQAKGELDPAVRDYTVALQLKPDFVVALENRARVYERKGIHDMARKDRAAAAQLKAGATPQHAPGPVSPGQQPLGAPPSPAVTASNNRMILIIGGVVLGALLLIAIIVSAMQGMHPNNSSSQVALNSSASSALSAMSSAVSSNPADAASIADANNRGDAAFKAGDYVGAMQAYMIAANQGDSSAEYNVGWLYDNGDGVAQDYSQALHWYTLAANQGDSSACRTIWAKLLLLRPWRGGRLHGCVPLVHAVGGAGRTECRVQPGLALRSRSGRDPGFGRGPHLDGEVRHAGQGGRQDLARAES